ncbi:nitrilase-related carbon-nitrogen hydrolase [Fluviibacterium sp. DFM31]|uniref:Nitrilase-related carbon-nitrogen hydrolase n=1 Tax=Meridianimarinicoccus marinus TaxID=3231483 RepID=A0ABV3LB72_9RHOB
MIPPRDIAVAAAAYPVEALPDLDALEAKLDHWVASANADLLVFPEYAGMEVALAGAPRGLSVAAWCHHAADLAATYWDMLAGLARRHTCHILTGSLPAHGPDGALRNRAQLVAPSGRMAAQDKRILTPWERRETLLTPADATAVFDTDLGRIGVLICYDAEFPLAARGLEADLLLVPACTDLPAGDGRVRVGARARALEQQAVVLHAPLLGAMPDCPLIDTNRGRAGIFCPCDTGFPDDGILANGAPDSAGWVRTSLSKGLISEARIAAAVDVPGHWAETTALPAPIRRRI